MLGKLKAVITFGLLACATLIVVAIPGSRSTACPFCTAVSQTFAEEINGMDVAVIAELLKDESPKEESDEASILDGPDNTRSFKIVKIIKGDKFLEKGMVFQVPAFGDLNVGDNFMVMGVEPPNVNWTTPLKMTKLSIEYVDSILDLPKEGAKRLEFFQDFLEHKEEMLARDAYDEFAKAPYKAVIDLKPKMDRAKLVGWLKDLDIPATRKRLYYTMLGVCGTEAELPILEELMKSDDRLKKAGLDALIACYLTIKGEAGMPLIEELFIKNKDCEYSDTYAAIAALRFHGTEAEVIKKKRIVEGMRHMLLRPRLADLVIPDLARWQDWSVMDELVTLFKDSSDETSWVRVPVINYLRACPLEIAKKHIKELEKIDPAAVKRANTFFPLPSDDEDEDEDDTEESDTEESDTEESDTEESDTEESDTEESDTEESDTKESDTKESDTKESDTKESSTDVKPAVFNAPVDESLNSEKSDVSPSTEPGDSPENGNSESCFTNSESDSTQNNVSTQLVNHTEVITTELVADASEVIDPIESETLVAESANSNTLMVLGIPFLFSGFLFVLLWLVISGRIDRIAV